MRVAHLIFSLQTGSTANMLVDIVNDQSRYCEVALFVINNSVDQEALQKLAGNVNVILIGRPAGSRHLTPLLKLNYYLSKWNPEIIHCHNPNIIAMLVNYWKGSRAVLTLYNNETNSSPYINRYKKVYTVSKALARMVAKDIALTPQVVPAGIYADTILTKATDAWNAGTTFRIAQIGKLEHKNKGQHLLIKALNLLDYSGHKNIRVDFIGKGPSQRYLEDMTVNYRLKDRVSFLGFKDREYIFGHLKDYDLLVHASVDEDFSLAVIEAMAAKVPVLVSDTKVFKEMIDHEMLGFSFNTKDPLSLADNISLIMNSAATTTTAQLTERAYRHALLNFDTPRAARAYLSDYETIVGQSYYRTNYSLAHTARE